MNIFFSKIYFKLCFKYNLFRIKCWIIKAKKEGLLLGENCSFSLPVHSIGMKNILIGDNFKAGERLKLRAFNNWEGESFNPKIIIGNNVNIETDCHISAINKVEIGDNVLIASFVFISDHSHGNINVTDLDKPPLERPLFSKGPIVIKNNVWIGEKATILSNVTIGENSVIGANSVVTKDIPPNCVACGNPAKVIKTLI